jgi:hypothetical protein
MRAPPESLSPMIGAPFRTARSMTLQILAACPSASDPPNTVKSCENAYTRRPSMRPKPVTTPSPMNRSSSDTSSFGRGRTNASSSANDPSSSSRSMRSRAVSLPFACCCSMRASPPPAAALRRMSSRRSVGFTG